MDHAGSLRSTKRRRLNGHSSRRDEEEDLPTPSRPEEASSENGDEDISDDCTSEPELPSMPRTSEDLSDSSAAAPRRNPRIHVPTHVVNDENTFVTQLTQPPSSPSRIRGPRWKKNSEPADEPQLSSDPSSAKKPSLVNETTVDRRESGCTDVDNVDAFHQDNLESLADDFDDDNIEEVMMLGATQLASSEPPSRGVRQSQNMRQTTLFGHATTSSSPIATQGRTHNWPLSSKPQQLTHHQLDSEALKTWVYPTNLGSTRDYQFNIVQRGLYHNTLVALPTGLGKTFIAATIMLNWYRWTKDSQIVFVAPTKPLVAQQVEACFNVVGIPRSETSMLTGNVQPALRAEEWNSKRVFFMTPQTLQHDLASGICDPKKIVLLVIDEAHRATGNYSYVEVVRFLRRFNPSFRVLALTATPGSTVESVQNVIDGLDIARVEIRTEESLDIRQYVHRRNIEMEVFDYSEEVTTVMELFSKALKPVVNKLTSQNAYWSKDPMALTAFGLTKARQQWMASEAGRRASYGLKGMMNSIFSLLASLAHSIDLLKYHGLGPFYSNMVTFRAETLENNKSGKYAKEIVNHENFKKMMSMLQAWVNNPDFVGHPKLSFLKSIVLNHFMDAGEGRGAAGGRPPSDTRIMVFVHFRDSAEEVARILKRHEPMIRPHVFVGQAGSKGSAGMDQKTQLDIIEKFKSGVYNTIVATSIGEEGLDIGEIDLIVCYDSSSSPIRMLQRMGRTGRKRAGNIYLLLMRGKEEESYTKAKDNYEKMQAMIAQGSRFLFHDDRSPRIVPREVQPVVDKRQIEIPVENSQVPEPKKGRRVPKKPPKKFFMPDGVEHGFVKASHLGRKRPNDQDLEEAAAPHPPLSPQESLEPIPLPRLEKVLLSSSQEAELEEHYCSISGDSPQFVHVPDLGSFPSLQRARYRTAIVPHSKSSVNLSRALSVKSPFADRIRPQDPFESKARRGSTPNIVAEDMEPALSKGHRSRVAHSSPGLWSSSDESPPPELGHFGVDKPSRFYVSQPEKENEDDSGDDLPDPSQLLHSHDDGDKENIGKDCLDNVARARPRQRRRRLVLDDDDDDDGDDEI